MEPGQPTVTLFCGPPGAGKSTVARDLEREGHGIRICTDDWQVAIGDDPDDDDFHGRLQRVLYRHALNLLAYGTNVILEDGLWTAEERAVKFADARQEGARIVWHVFDLSRDELLRRNRVRNNDLKHAGARMSEEDIDKILRIFQPPDADEMALADEVVIHR